VKPRKMDQYLAEGRRLVALVNAHRAARDEARSDASHAYPSAEGAPVTQSVGEPAPTPTKRKSYRLPPLETPMPIPGFPLAPSRPGEDVEDYGTVNRVRRLRKAGRTRPLLVPIGPPELRKASQ
jgi:hypothetical protein